MDLSLSPSEREFRDEVRTWLEENHPGPEPEGSLGEGMAFRREWQGRAHQAGAGGLSPGAGGRGSGGAAAPLLAQPLCAGGAARKEAPGPAKVVGLAMGGPVVRPAPSTTRC